jgi:signal peptidase I
VTYVRRAVAATLVVALLALAAGALLWLQGYRVYAVKTGSMSPAYPTGSLVVATPVERVLPGVGEVVTFRTGAGLVTHRVHERSPGRLTTKGDANRTPDPWTVAREDVVGTVRTGLAGGGYVLVFLQQPTGVPSLVLLGLSVAFAWTLFFPSTTGGSDPGPRHRARRHLGRLPAAAGAVLVAAAAAAGLGGWVAAEPTAAYFTDAASGTISFTTPCDDRHDHGHGPGNGNGHNTCRGKGHTGDTGDGDPDVTEP